MKRLAAIILGLWCASAAAEVPFAPTPNVPDYIAAYNNKPNSARIDGTLVMRHGDWIRSNGEIDNTYRSTTYVRIADPLTITVQHELADASRHTSLGIRRGIEGHRSHGWSYDSFKTGEQDVVLGEPCELWDVARTSVGGPGNTSYLIKRLSCVSHDGIQLRTKFVSERYGESSSAEAISIVRRPVDARDVQPPADLFDLKTWLADPDPASDRPGDATVTMENLHAGAHPRSLKSRIVRRHHPWTRAEDIYVGGQRHGTIANDSQRLTMNFEVNPDGQYTRLGLSKTPLVVVLNIVRTMQPVELKEKETILGETCTWFDMWPGMMDASRHECRTSDGLVLKERRGSRGSSVEFIATRLDRGPMPLSEVSPAAMLARSNWGLAE